MAIQSWTASIKGVDDFELGIPRTTPLVYHCTAPTDGKAEGLVFLIPDFNEDVDGEGFASLREQLAQAYGLLAISVEYHCYRSRLKDGARLDLGPDAFAFLRSICERHAVALIDTPALFSALSQLPVPYEFQVRIIPPNKEYQNLGLMASLDHLAVLQDILFNKQWLFDEGNIIALGEGYGGYLAHLLAKIAPNTFRAVFECTSITRSPLGYLFSGAQRGDVAYYYEIGKVKLAPLIDTRWTSEKNSPNYFSSTRQAIRDVSNIEHIRNMRLSTKRACQYRIMNGFDKSTKRFQEKVEQAKQLQDAGYDVVMLEQGDRKIGDDNALPVDNLRAMFQQCYPELPESPGIPDHRLSSSIAYLCGDFIYSFEYGASGCQPSIVRLHNPESPPTLLY